MQNLPCLGWSSQQLTLLSCYRQNYLTDPFSRQPHDVDTDRGEAAPYSGGIWDNLPLQDLGLSQPPFSMYSTVTIHSDSSTMKTKYDSKDMISVWLAPAIAASDNNTFHQELICRHRPGNEGFTMHFITLKGKSQHRLVDVGGLKWNHTWNLWIMNTITHFYSSRPSIRAL